MAEHDFILQFDLGEREFDDNLCNEFFEKTDGDALFGITSGVPNAIYTREAETQGAAILAAIEEAKELGFTITGIEAHPRGEMKLYHWDAVETLKNYGTGDAVIMARSEAEARAVFRRDLEKWLREHRDYYFTDPDDTELADEALALADRDALAPIAGIFEVPTGIIVRGSD